MPPTAENLKPAPRCCCVLGTEAHATRVGEGHRVVILGVALHAEVHEQLMLAPSHAVRAARQLIAAARECGEDVPVGLLEAAALDVPPARHGYEKPLPTIDYAGGYRPAAAGNLVAWEPPPRRSGRPSKISDEQVEAAWARFLSGTAPIHKLATDYGCEDVMLSRRFEQLHGPQFALIRYVYAGGRRGAPVQRDIERLLGGDRPPVLKPNGTIL